MSKKEKLLGLGVVVAIVLAITGLFFPKVASFVGAPAFTDAATTVYTQLGVTDGLIVGTSGVGVSKLIPGTCNLISYTPSFTATSTLAYGCAATGVVSGDKVFAQLPLTSTGAGAVSFNANGIFLSGASASSTNGYIQIQLTNLTGAATTSFPQATTSVQYWVVR